MPYENEHSAVVGNPADFEPNFTRRLNKSGGVSIIIGKLKESGKTAAKSYRFDKKKFTPDEAREWLKKHGQKTISFEKAKD